jgi:hypothetical protein
MNQVLVDSSFKFAGTSNLFTFLKTMNVQIIHEPLTFHLHGFSGTAANKNYAKTAFVLSGKLWQTVRANNLKNKGINIWAYEPGELVFAGVELDGGNQEKRELEEKTIQLVRYAYYKHVGQYSLLHQAGDEMRTELRRQGFEPTLPYIEKYGHWQSDETKLETELFMYFR